MSFRVQRQKNLYKRYYKQSMDENQLKRDREDQQLSVRKQKRKGEMAKRRNICIIEEDEDISSIDPKLELLPQYANEIRSDNYNIKLHGISCVRDLLSSSEHPPIEQVIALGIAQDLVNILNMSKDTNIQYQSAWALSNIASGTNEQTNALLDYGAVPAFISILSGNYDIAVKDQAIWALGNIAADSTAFRDFILYHHVLDNLIAYINGPPNTRLQKTATWCVANLCRGSPSPPFDVIQYVIEPLLHILQCNNIKQQIRSDACWALAHLLYSGNSYMSYLLNKDVYKYIIPLLISQSEKLYTPAIRCIGNILSGDNNDYTKLLIELNILEYFGNLINICKNESVLVEIFWTLSNIAAISQEYIQYLINYNNLLSNILNNIQVYSINVKCEIAWIFTNIASEGSIEQCNYIVSIGIIGIFSHLLTIPDIKLLSIVINGLKYIFDSGKRGGYLYQYCSLFEELGGLNIFNTILDTKDIQIHDIILDILDNYFKDHMDDEEEYYIEPDTIISDNTNNNIFSF